MSSPVISGEKGTGRGGLNLQASTIRHSLIPLGKFQKYSQRKAGEIRHFSYFSSFHSFPQGTKHFRICVLCSLILLRADHHASGWNFCVVYISFPLLLLIFIVITTWNIHQGNFRITSK